MQQRVVIAMALASDPVLLVLDEPTTALDATVQADILDLFQDLRGELKAAILFISHNLAVVQQVCDRIGVMYAGELIEQGTVAEVFHRPVILKEELGLDQLQGRSWTGLHRHALMTCIAYAYLQHLRLSEHRRTGRGKNDGPLAGSAAVTKPARRAAGDDRTAVCRPDSARPMSALSKVLQAAVRSQSAQVVLDILAQQRRPGRRTPRRARGIINKVNLDAVHLPHTALSAILSFSSRSARSIRPVETI